MMNGPVVNGQEIEEKVRKLLSQMTVREKIGQCVMIEPCFCLAEQNDEDNDVMFSDILDPKFLDKLMNEYHIGLFLYGGVSRIGDDSAKDWVEYLSKVDEHVQNTRLKIPMLYGVDGVHGVNFVQGSTIFSHNLGVTATWNPELAEEYARVVGDELKSVGINCNFAPTVDVARDQRWGRVYEALGEDPYLARIMSGSLVRGMQSSGSVGACAKHFIGYGEANNGMDRTPADMSERSIMDTHVPPFQAAIDENVQAIMVNGGDVNGVPMPVSKKMLKGLLRDQLGFKGVTMSDWEDVYRLLSRHKVVTSRKDGICRAFNAGLDMNMAVSDLKAVDIMEELIDEGRITMERLDEACGNVLRMKFNLGLFEKPALDVEKAIELNGSDRSKEVARQLALESMTLLKNENKTLPLSKSLKSILVTGQTANTKRHMCGGWTLSWASADEDELNSKKILEAIKDKVSEDTVITYAESVETLSELQINPEDYDICISVVGEEPHSEWLGDSMSLRMEEEEEALLRAAVGTGIPVVMVGMIGRPQQLMWADQNTQAILWAYLPGTEGADPIADVLFGDYNPSGHTSISFPKNGNQIPVVYDARRYECHEITTKYEPLYPFGHGLSYTEFEYSGLEVPETVPVGIDMEVSVKVKNIGDVSGAAVVQVYLTDEYASVTRPLKSLKAFKKVFLEAGEQQEITLLLTPKELSLYDEDLNFVQEKRRILVQIGSESSTFQLI